VLVRLGQEVQEVPRGLRARRRLIAGFAGLLVTAVAATASSAPPTVTISGRAYAFNHMDTFLQGATIRVREYPKLSATTDANGDYLLKVPDDANVTPYIEPPAGYHQIDLQTFHTRGEPILNANFQTPGDTEYNGLAALLNVPLGPDGRPTQCVIVTTASARDVRGVDYATFEERTPHGVPGATAHAVPPLPNPTYFNENVIPDPSQTQTSGDGGIVWTGVSAGAYRVITESSSTRFASFLATCEPGRIVNANPPWGAYELTGKEKPLGAGTVAGSVSGVSNGERAGHRLVVIGLDAAERLQATGTLRRGGRLSAEPRTTSVSPPRGGKLVLRVLNGADAGKAKLSVELTDAAGESSTERFSVRLPAP
jgi:hypothetical protein